MTILDSIAAHFGYVPRVEREYERVNNGTDAVARGQRWEAFATEEDGLYDMIANLRRGYFEKVGQLRPGDTESLQALAAADRIARELERQVQTVIETGKVRAADRQHTARVAGIRG